MKLKLLAVALLASAALVPNSEAGNRHGGGGGNAGAARAGAMGGGGPSFRSMPARGFSSNRIYSGQHFSSMGTRYPRMNSNLSARQFTGGGNIGANRINQFNNQRFAGMGRGFASNNAMIGNRTGGGQFHNGNRLAPNWRNHVVAQHAGNWHNWDHHHDHWWHGHRCCFIGGSWFVFDVGFFPWWPWYWDYPYYGYGYGYGYPYNYGYYPNGYGYGYSDPGVYNGQPVDGYEDQSGYQNGYEDQSRYQNRSGAQSANSTVAAAQEKLVHEGFYNGQIDGVLGPETRHSLVRFQTKHGLRISGELTTETLDALGLRQYANYGSN